MNRRDFFKASAGAALGLALPIQLSATLVIVDVKILDTFARALRFRGYDVVDKQAVMNVDLDTKELWQHVRVVDADGREWATNDRGATWRCGLMEFSLKGEQGENNNTNEVDTKQNVSA